MPRIVRYLAWRLLQAIPIVAGIAVFNFMLLQLAPGDAADVLAGEAGGATPEYMAELKARFGLDQPVPVQLARYLWNVARLDLGFSFRHNMPVIDLILSRLPATLLLMVAAIVLALGLGDLREEELKHSTQLADPERLLEKARRTATHGFAGFLFKDDLLGAHGVSGNSYSPRLAGGNLEKTLKHAVASMRTQNLDDSRFPPASRGLNVSRGSRGRLPRA